MQSMEELKKINMRPASQESLAESEMAALPVPKTQAHPEAILLPNPLVIMPPDAFQAMMDKINQLIPKHNAVVDHLAALPQEQTQMLAETTTRIEQSVAQAMDQNLAAIPAQIRESSDAARRDYARMIEEYTKKRKRQIAGRPCI
jgi:hypothetical protein